MLFLFPQLVVFVTALLLKSSYAVSVARHASVSPPGIKVVTVGLASAVTAMFVGIHEWLFLAADVGDFNYLRVALCHLQRCDGTGYLPGKTSANAGSGRITVARAFPSPSSPRARAKK